ncbi:hypothetical protein V6N13_047247 [Hibiscus sabdariffa]|uniref:Wall-associated receptor kinase galacturonan-binding domain-containing protein n=1 Tax=Hibiscus sabdariffa TaxID=183260 RepID=A0ABR2F3I6_9ROSI
MGVGLVFCFILQLPGLIPAVIATGATQPHSRYRDHCDETCEDVSIPYPFGIRGGCYYNSWFRVTCKETAHGRKPFISRINLELVDLYWADENSIIVVNNPVIYLNCGNKSSTSPSSVNLQGSPFIFSSRFNQFGSVGCDNFAAVFPNNQTDAISSCLQKSCGDLASKSHGDGCHAIISENITFYTASAMEVIRPDAAGNPSCTSAFIFCNPMSVPIGLQRSGSCLAFPDNISIDTTHVLAALEWNPCDLDAALCPKRETSDAGCTGSCGNVEILYPFGIEVGCYMNEWFRVTCDETTNVPKPYLTRTGLQLLTISIPEGTVVVNNPVTYSGCFMVSVNSTGIPMVICANFGTSNVSCSSELDITWDLSPNRRLCGSAFIVNKRYLETIFLNSHGASNWTLSHIPTTLQWSTRIRGWCECRDGPNVFSSLNGQYLWKKLGQSYLCVCAANDDGLVSTAKCRDHPTPCPYHYRYTYMLCLSTPDNNCSPSSCAQGYWYSGYECVPKEKLNEKSHYLAISIGCSTSLGTLFVLLGTWHLYKVLERRKSIKLKQKYFKRNGGLLLQQQVSSDEANVGKVKIFASEELEKATDYFNENRILGRGGQGTVYKGMLTNGSIVAIKQSKLVEEKTFDETKLEQFINEDNSLLDIVDPVVQNDCPEEEIVAVAKLAKRCLNLNGKKRPTMKQVVLELEWIRSSEEANVIQQTAEEDYDTDDMFDVSGITSCSTTGSVLKDSVTLSLDA